MNSDFELDPERALWKPTRRFFLMGLGAAAVASVLPAPVPVQPSGLIFTDCGVSMRLIREYDLLADRNVSRLDILIGASELSARRLAFA